MRIIDVDAHLHEPLDWVERTDSALARELGPPARFMEIADSVFSNPGPSFATLPEAQRPAGRFDLVPPGFVHHLEETDARQPERHEPGSDDPLYAAPARLAFCDRLGIDVQFLNPTFLVGAFVQAGRAGRPELFQRVREAWNTWSSEQVAGHTGRLIPVTQIDLTDVEWSIAEMTRMRARGSRAFAIPEAPVRPARPVLGTPRAKVGRSITHPDFESIWSAAEDLEMAAFGHVGFSREKIQLGWANNGDSDLQTFSLLNMLVGSQIGPQLLVGAMVYDGLLERHPQLVLVMEEVGIDWLPHLLDTLDASIGRYPDDLRDGNYRPSHLEMGKTYHLPLAPSEYVRRQVRATPLPASQPLRPVIDRVPSEILCFSSDYPHVEGSDDAVTLCERQLVHLPAPVREGFFGGVGELLGV